MRGHDIVVVGASAGGVEALGRLVRTLPPEFPAALFMVLHVPSSTTSALPSILDRQGPLPAAHARDGERIRYGRIYVAPPDSHMLIGEGAIRLSRGPRENGHRPAIDPTFRSAARSHGPCTVGVVLSGVLDDGTAGLLAIKARGGIAVVQDPDDALYPSMPSSAIDHVKVDHVVACPAIAALLGELAEEPPPHHELFATDNPVRAEVEPEELTSDPPGNEPATTTGRPSIFACPDCDGGTVGDPGRRPGTVPLPRRPRLVAGEPAQPPERGAGRGAVGGAAEPAGARGPGPPDGRPGARPRLPPHGGTIRRPGTRGRAGGRRAARAAPETQ
jgi:two-component system chemotaxis response regulator CheB